MRLNEIFFMRMELAKLLPTLGERQWALLSNLGSENSTVNENYDVGSNIFFHSEAPLLNLHFAISGRMSARTTVAS